MYSGTKSFIHYSVLPTAGSLKCRGEDFRLKDGRIMEGRKEERHTDIGIAVREGHASS